MTMQTREKTEPRYKDFLKILIAKINLANTANQNQYVYCTQFDIEELKIYTYTM